MINKHYHVGRVIVTLLFLSSLQLNAQIIYTDVAQTKGIMASGGAIPFLGGGVSFCDFIMMVGMT